MGWGGGGRKVPVAAVGLSAGNGDVEVTGSERSEAARKLSWSQVAEEGRGAEGRVFEVGRSETRKIATSSSPSSGFGVAERTGLYGGFQEVDVWERGGGGGNVDSHAGCDSKRGVGDEGPVTTREEREIEVMGGD